MRQIAALPYRRLRAGEGQHDRSVAGRPARGQAARQCAGKAGTSFTARSRKDVRAKLLPLIRRAPALAKPLCKKDTVSVEPKIEFRGMTSDGILPHASLNGLA